MLTAEQKARVLGNMGVQPKEDSWEDDWKQAAGLKTNKQVVEEIETKNSTKQSNVVSDFLVGAGKGILSTGKGVSEFMSKIPVTPLGIAQKASDIYKGIKGEERESIVESAQTKSEETLGFEKGTFTEPKTSSQKAGFLTEQVAEYLLPTGVEKTALKALDAFADMKKLSGLVGGLFKVGSKAGVEALSSAGVTTLQEGGDLEKTKEAFTSGGLGSLAFSGLGKLGEVGSTVAKFISSKMSGVPVEAINHAFNNPEAVQIGIKNAIKYGDEGVEKIYEKAVDSLNTLKQARKTAYEKGLEKLEKETMTTKKGQLYVKKPSEVSTEPILTPTKLTLGGIKNVFTRTLNEFGVPFKNKTIDTLESTLTPEHNTRLQQLGDIIYSWKNLTPKGIDNLAQKIDNFRLGGVNLGPSEKKFNSIISKMVRNTRDYVGEKVPQVKELHDSYRAFSEVIEKITDDLNLERGKSKTAVTRKLMNVFNPKSEAYRPVVELLGEKGANDLLSDIAGALMSKATPEGLGAYITSAIGIINPLTLIPSIIGSSPRLVGEFTTKMGEMSKNPKIQESLNAFRKGIIGAGTEIITENEE